MPTLPLLAGQSDAGQAYPRAAPKMFPVQSHAIEHSPGYAFLDTSELGDVVLDTVTCRGHKSTLVPRLPGLAPLVRGVDPGKLTHRVHMLAGEATSLVAECIPPQHVAAEAQYNYFRGGCMVVSPHSRSAFPETASETQWCPSQDPTPNAQFVTCQAARQGSAGGIRTHDAGETRCAVDTATYARWCAQGGDPRWTPLCVTDISGVAQANTLFDALCDVDRAMCWLRDGPDKEDADSGRQSWR